MSQNTNPSTEELLKMCQGGGSIQIGTQRNSTKPIPNSSQSQSGNIYATESTDSLNGIVNISVLQLDE